MKRALMMALVAGCLLTSTSSSANASDHHGGNVRSSGFGLSLNFGSPYGSGSNFSYNRGYSNNYNGYGGYQQSHNYYQPQRYVQHGSYYPAYRQAVPSYGFSNFRHHGCGY